MAKKGGQAGTDGYRRKAGRYGESYIKPEWVRRGVIQGGPAQQAVPDHAPQQAGRYGKESRAGQYRRARSGRYGGEGGWVALTS